MTILTDGEETWAQKMLGRAETAFSTAQLVLQSAIEKLKAEQEVSGTDLSKDLRAMNHALMMAMGFEGKTRDAAAEQASVGADALDLDAARAEIGCRLDCLRAARGGGGVSGEPAG